MKTEPKRKKSQSFTTPDLEKSMRTFFHAWLKGGELQEEWCKRKEIARNKIEKFLQEDSGIFFQAKKNPGENWLEQIIRNLENLEKAQLAQRFLTANMRWDSHDKKQTITLQQIDDVHFKANPIEPSLSETIIFMPETNKNLDIDATDVLRKGLTNLRAFFNIIYLSEKCLNDEKISALDLHLKRFKQEINHQRSENRAMKYAERAYKIFSNKLVEVLVEAGLYVKKNDAREGIAHMADFLWSKNYEKFFIYIQHTSFHQTNILVFEPKSLKGSSDKDALWIQKITKKHPWVKKLPWQVLERPRPSMSRDGEGLKIEKATLVSVKKTMLRASKEETYVVDCMPMGELGGTPVPFGISDLAERYRITLKNQKSIFLGSQTPDDKPPFLKLEEVIHGQIQLLENIMTKERRKKGITIPLSDINFTQRIFPYTYKNSGTGWLQDRVDANKMVRKILQNYLFFYDTLQLECVYLDKKAEDFDTLQQKYSAENYIPIYVIFLYPTVVYNNFKIFSYRTNEDINGLRASVKIAIERLEMFKEKLIDLGSSNEIYQQDIKDIDHVQRFLQGGGIGLFQLQGIPDRVISCARRISEKLRDAQYFLSDEVGENRKIQISILKILQSSLIVKEASSESIFGFFRRFFDNFFIGTLLIIPENQCFRNFLTASQFPKILLGLFCLLLSPFFVIGWSARLFLTLSTAIMKIPSGIFYGLQNMAGKTQNKSARLAAAVGILFSATGKKKLNFKSTADCALPIFFLIYAMINHAIYGEPENGKVPLMTDCNNKWAFSKDTVGTTIRHQKILKTVGLLGS